LVEVGELSKEPDKIASFLKVTKGLDKGKIGEYIGDRFVSRSSANFCTPKFS
jgi:hypothetical protein